MVPKGWSVNTLADAGVVVIDGDRGKEYPKSTEFYSSGYCVFLSAKNVSKGGFAFNEVQFIDEQKHLKLRKGLVNRGNIVLTTRGTVGQFAYFDDSVPYDVMRINSGMVVLDVDKSLFHGDFFYALCRSSIVNKQIEAASFGSAQPQLTVGIIKGLTLPIPPLPEQKKIAKILSTWDQAISTTEQLLANSQQQKKALMQQLLTGKKRLLDKNGVRFSGEWKHIKLANICSINPLKSPEPEDGAVSFVSMDSVSNDAKLLRTEKKQYADVSKGFTSFVNHDVLVAKITPCFENGKGAFVDGLINGIGFGSTEFHVLRAFKETSAEYLYHFTNTSEFRVRGEANMQGSAGQKRVTTDYLKGLKIYLPLQQEEQNKIAAVLSAADQKIETLQRKLDCLKQEKKALMQQLLTGKKRVSLDIKG